MAVRPGLLTANSAELLTAYQGRAQAVARGLADWRARQIRRERFPARVNSYDAATSRYAWTEQAFDANGNRYDKPGGRTGSAVWSPAYAYGDGQVVTEFPYPTTLTRRVVTDTLGPVYEFPLYCACAAGDFVLVACCSNPIPTTLYATVGLGPASACTFPVTWTGSGWAGCSPTEPTLCAGISCIGGSWFGTYGYGGLNCSGGFFGPFNVRCDPFFASANFVDPCQPGLSAPCVDSLFVAGSWLTALTFTE